MLAYLTFELRRLYREPRLLVLTIAMPIIIFLGIGSTIKGDTPEQTKEIVRYLLVAWAAYGALIGTFSTAVGVSHERASGWLGQLRVTPMPPLLLVTAKGAVCTLVAIPAVASISLVGALVKGVHMQPAQWLELVAFMWLGAIPFALLGLAVGFVLPPNLAQPASFLVTFTLAFAGGIFIPITSLPAALANVAEWLPSFRFSQLGQSVLANEAPPTLGLLILAAWVAIFALLAMLAYRRSAASP